MEKYVKIYHIDSTIETIKDLFDKEKIYGITERDFLDCDDGNGTNRKRIFEAYDEIEKEKLSINVESDVRTGVKLPTPVVFCLPVRKATKALIYTQTNFQIQDDNISNEVNRIIQGLYNLRDPEFQEQTFGGDDQLFSRVCPDQTVWIYCKSLAESGNGIDDGGLIDVTPFVQFLSTSETENGGNFTLKLAPIPSVYFYKDEKDGIWRLDASTFTDFTYAGSKNIVSRASVNRTGGINRTIVQIDSTDFGGGLSEDNTGTTNIRRRQRFFFNDTIKENDVVFIRFEKLKNEFKRSQNLEELTINPTELPGQFYDMIGLVDNNNVTYEAGNVAVDIDISGRDLIKLLIDDGCFFFNKELVNPDKTGVFQNEKDIQSRSIERLLSNRLNILAIDQNRNIDFIIKLLIAQLANIQVVPDGLFDAYTDKTTFQIPEEK
jgi:hypothetical protein